MTNFNEVLSKLEETIKKISVLTKFENLSLDSAKQSNSYEKLVDECVNQLISTDEGISLYKKWLNSNDNELKWNAGLNLFPIYPNKCLSALIECEKNCTDKLTKSSMNDVITSYEKPLNDNNTFYTRLRKMFKTANLELLRKSD